MMLFVWLALCACTPEPVPGVTETGNPALEAGVSVRARSTQPGTISVGGDGETNVDGLWLAVESVELFERTTCDEARPSFVDPFIVDAAARVPKVERGQTEQDVYCAARVGLNPTATPEDGPPELQGNTLVMTGVSEENRPFVIRSRMAFDVVLSRDEGNFIVDATHDRLDVGIDVAVWLDEIWVDDGRPDDAGVLVFDESSNTTILREFEAGLRDAMDLDIGDD